jgi:hypothetical protein
MTDEAGPGTTEAVQRLEQLRQDIGAETVAATFITGVMLVAAGGELRMIVGGQAIRLKDQT